MHRVSDTKPVLSLSVILRDTFTQFSLFQIIRVSILLESLLWHALLGIQSLSSMM